MREDMRISYHNGIQYIQGGNFVRAKEELRDAYGLAERLMESKYKNDVNNYIMLVDAVIYADGLFEDSSYEKAADAYGAAASQSKYADNLAMDYIDAQRGKAADCLNVHEYVFLGDALADIRDWDNAEQKYMAARSLASRIHYTEGRKLANDALDALYRKKQQDVDERAQASMNAAREEFAAAEFVVEGDASLRNGDYSAALLYYELARDKYAEMGNEAIAASLAQRMKLANEKMAESESRLDSAIVYMKVGDELTEIGQYVDAKRVYLLARDIFAGLGEEDRLREVLTRIEMVDLYLISMPAKTADADEKKGAPDSGADDAGDLNGRNSDAPIRPGAGGSSDADASEDAIINPDDKANAEALSAAAAEEYGGGRPLEE